MAERVLKDSFGRRIEYLRLSVTDRCDLRCSYCLPKGFSDFNDPDEWLRFDEIARVVAIFARLGVGKIRLTGGEPLTRRDFPALASRLARLPGVTDLSLSSNATQLARQASALRRAGIRRLNVSLDSLVRERFAEIVRRDCLPQVIEGLLAAKAEGFAPIKINMVVMKGVNDDEIEPMVEFCIEHGFVLRLIETMPLGAAGGGQYVDLQPARQRLVDRYGLIEGTVEGAGPARYLQSRDGSFSVGFITPMSQHFCETCNRVRLSADGDLLLCLGKEERVSLRALLRSGADDEALERLIRDAIELKPEQHEFKDKPCDAVRFMSQIGG